MKSSTLAAGTLALIAASTVAATVSELRLFPESSTTCAGPPLMIKRTRNASGAACPNVPATTGNATQCIAPTAGSKFSTQDKCITSFSQQLDLTSETDVFAAINILTSANATAEAAGLKCSDEKRVESTTFYLADGKCHPNAASGSGFVRAACQPNGQVTVSACTDSACKECPQSILDKEGVCSDGKVMDTDGLLVAKGKNFYMQCYAAEGSKGTPESIEDEKPADAEGENKDESPDSAEADSEGDAPEKQAGEEDPDKKSGANGLAGGSSLAAMVVITGAALFV